MIREYFSEVKSKLEEIRDLIRSESTTFNMISDDMAIIKGKIQFINGSILDFRELISSKDHDYRFHWMDEDKRMISRWDTAPHHRELETFPFHKHESDGVKPCDEIRLIEVINTIKRELIKELET